MNHLETLKATLVNLGYYPLLRATKLDWRCDLANHKLRCHPTGTGLTAQIAMEAANLDRIRLEALPEYKALKQ